MSPAFWFTVQAGKVRIRIPLPVLLPLTLLLDLLVLVTLVAMGCLQRRPLFLRLGLGFAISRLTLGLILHSGRFRIAVNDKDQRVRIHGGWR